MRPLRGAAGVRSRAAGPLREICGRDWRRQGETGVRRELGEETGGGGGGGGRRRGGGLTADGGEPERSRRNGEGLG